MLVPVRDENGWSLARSHPTAIHRLLQSFFLHLQRPVKLSLFTSIRFYVVRVHFDPADILPFEATVLRHQGSVVASAAAADIVLSKVVGRKRLEMLLGKDVLVSVSPQHAPRVGRSISYVACL